jgi:ferredoxin
MARVRFEPNGVELECSSEKTLLESLVEKGYQMCVGCRRGGCGICLVEVKSGEFELRPHAKELITQRSQTLACRAMPQSDAVVMLCEDNKFKRSGLYRWLERAGKAGTQV